jgi:hypothetical protein
MRMPTLLPFGEGRDGKWKEVDSSDVGHNGRNESAFTDLFGCLTALPTIAFQARPEH